MTIHLRTAFTTREKAEEDVIVLSMAIVLQISIRHAQK